MRSKTTLRHLGDEVRDRRTALGLTQESLAAAAGVHLNTLGKLERGAYNPSLLLVEAVATTLNASLAELFASVEERQTMKA